MKKLHTTAAYTLLQMATWGFFAVPMGFASNFLRAHGFQDGEISLLLGLATGTSCLLQLGAAELISRLRRLTPYRVLLVMGALILTGALAMLNPWHGWLAVGGLAVCCAVLQGIPAMVNAMGMGAIRSGSPTNYSVARGVGSLSYSLVAILAGRLVTKFGVGAIGVMVMAVAAMLLTGAVWYHLVGEAGMEPSPPKRRGAAQRGGFLKANRTYALFLAGSVLLFISHNLISNFMFQIITAKGGGASQQGVAVALAAFLELPVMLAFPLMLKWMGCERWLQFSAAFFLAKALGLYFAADCAGVYAAQTLQMLGYAVFTISSVPYAESSVERGETVRAQSYLAAASAVGGLIASSIGGVICQHLGTQAMLLTSAGAAALGAAIVVAVVRRRRGAAHR